MHRLTHQLCYPVLPAAFMASWLCSVGARAEMAQSCTEALAIESPEDTRDIRTALTSGLLSELPAASCSAVVIRLEPSPEGLIVLLERDGQVISRRVETAEHAVLWIESWLAEPEEIPADIPTAEEPPAEPSHQIETRLQVLGALSIAGDGFLWVGPGISVTSLLTRAVWFGGGVEMAFWTQEDSASHILRGDLPIARFAVRAGGRLPFGERLALDLGGGVGVTLDTLLDPKVNPFVELLAELEVILGRGFSFCAGLLGRVHMLHEVSRSEFISQYGGEEPPPASILAGELRLGLSYTFGGAR